MVAYSADIAWELKSGEDFLRGRYSRGHVVRFDGGITVAGSVSEQVVGKWAVAAAVDPEEMLVGALSACHMLSFLHVARLAGFGVASYADHAQGVMAFIAQGRQAVTQVVLHPRIAWTGAVPDKAILDQMHHDAHEACFIANSVKTMVTIDSSP